MPKNLNLSIKLYNDGSININSECCDDCFNKEIFVLHEFINGLVSNHKGMSPIEIIRWSEKP